jgi:hypothetical protein
MGIQSHNFSIVEEKTLEIGMRREEVISIFLQCPEELFPHSGPLGHFFQGDVSGFPLPF